MSISDQNLAVCQRCPFLRRAAGHGPGICGADGIDVAEHARLGQCPQNLYPPKPIAAQGPPKPTLAHGAAGVARAVTGTGGADAKTIEHRSRICAACPHNILTLGLINRCDLCGCLTWAKVRNATEKCPAGKW